MAPLTKEYAIITLLYLVAKVEECTKEEERFIEAVLEKEGLVDHLDREFIERLDKELSQNGPEEIVKRATDVLVNEEIAERERVIAMMVGVAMVTQEKDADAFGIHDLESTIVKIIADDLGVSSKRAAAVLDEHHIVPLVMRYRNER